MSIKKLVFALALPASLAASVPALAYYPFEARSIEGRGWSDPWVYGSHGRAPYHRTHAAAPPYPAYDVYSRSPRKGILHNYRSSGVTWGSYACERDPFYRADPRCLTR